MFAETGLKIRKLMSNSDKVEDALQKSSQIEAAAESLCPRVNLLRGADGICASWQQVALCGGRKIAMQYCWESSDFPG